MHRLEFLFQHIKPGVILDVGNLDKRGTVHQRIIDLFPTSEIYGLDVVNQENIGVSFKNQKIGSFEQMDYPENFFDTIYIGEVIEHTWKPKQVLDDCYRVLKSGGQLILDTPNVYSFSRMMRFFLTGKDIILGNPDHKIFFSRAMLENLLNQSGFKIKILTTEISFHTMHAKFKLPNFGSFKYMGECLLILAEKQ